MSAGLNKKVERLEDELAELEAEAGREIAELKEAMDPMNGKFEKIRLSPLEKNCSVKSVGIVWFPLSR